MKEWQVVVQLGSETLFLALQISAYVVLTILVVGLVASVLQTLTQIQDQTLTSVPKLFASYVVLVLGAAWGFAQVRAFAIRILDSVGGGP